MRQALVSFSMLLTIVCFGCSSDPQFKKLPDGPIKHHLIALGRTHEGLIAQGFASSTPPNTEINLAVKEKNARTISLADGSFYLSMKDADKEVTTGHFTFTVPGDILEQTYEIRDLAVALSAISKEPFALDKEVDALSFFNNHVAILSSRASLLQVFDLDEYFRIPSMPVNSILLNKDNPILLFPSSLAGLEDYVMVSLNLSHEVGLVDLKNSQVLKKAFVEDDQGQIFRTRLFSPLRVRRAIDAANTGTPATTITQTMARNPEAVFALDSHHFLVSFTNYFQYEDERFGDKAVVGPGIIALMSFENGKIITKAHAILNFKNPRYFVPKNRDEIWVVNAGAYKNIGKKNFTSKHAGLVRIQVSTDRNSFTVVHEIPLDFGPAPIAVLDKTLVIPEFEGNAIYVVNENANRITPSDKKTPNFHQAFAFTFATPWLLDLIFLGDKNGRLVAFNVKHSAFFPFPFIEPIFINTKIHEKIGLRPEMVYFRNQITSSPLTSCPMGYNAWVVSRVHQQIYPLDFLAVFGP
jgi:hypothetical protein